MTRMKTMNQLACFALAAMLCLLCFASGDGADAADGDAKGPALKQLPLPMSPRVPEVAGATGAASDPTLAAGSALLGAQVPPLRTGPAAYRRFTITDPAQEESIPLRTALLDTAAPVSVYAGRPVVILKPPEK